MFVSQALLICFMIYWLRNEYFGEQRILQKDLGLQLERSHQGISDSLITVNILDPIMKNMSGDSSRSLPAKAGRQLSGPHNPNQLRMVKGRIGKPVLFDSDVTVTMIGKTVDGISDIPSPHFVQRSDTIREMVIRPSLTPDLPDRTTSVLQHSEQTFTLRMNHRPDSGVHNKVDPSLTRSVRLLINETNKLPRNRAMIVAHPDTSELRTSFQTAINKSGYDLGSRWTITPALSEHRFLLASPDTPGQSLEILFYGRYLIRKIIPQMAFTLVLLSLSALAFWVTFRSLRTQMKLANIRNDFISNMSHELKTPVSTVKVALEALSEPEVLQDAETTQEYLHMATLEMARLELLVNQSLQSSLQEEGRMLLQPEPIDLRALAKDLIRSIQPRFNQQGASISFSEWGEDFIAAVDRLQVQGVILNILDNALKYAGPTPAIKVSITAEPQAVSISLSDNGPGIPQAYANRIFDKFFRVPRGNEHSVKGYGLGLSYASQVMKQHGGSISQQPSPEGGCNFILYFSRSLK